MTDTQPAHPEHRTPLHNTHVAAGAAFTDFAGWQMPVRYSSDLAEHHAVRTAAGMFDLSHMGEIFVIGPDAGAALDYALSGQPSALTEGRAAYSLLLSPSGGVLDDLIVYRTGADRFLVVANAANRELVTGELRARAAGFDAAIDDESEDMALIAVQGPASAEILSTTPGFAVDGGHANGEGFADALAALRYYRVLRASFESEPLLIARTGYTGEDGFELFVAPEVAGRLWEALAETGAPLGLVPAGLASRDTLRLEAGMPLYGHELDDTTFPAQAGLGGVVKLAKPVDFIGRAASEDGPAPEAPVLVGLRGDGRRAARADYEVYAGDELVGRITSGTLSPTLGVPIAMAYVAAAHAAVDTELTVDVRGSRLPMRVTELPFYRRKKN